MHPATAGPHDGTKVENTYALAWRDRAVLEHL